MTKQPTKFFEGEAAACRSEVAAWVEGCAEEIQKQQQQQQKKRKFFCCTYRIWSLKEEEEEKKQH